MLKYVKNNKYVVNLIKCIGSWEIELEAEADTPEEIYQLAKDLRTKFPAIIKRVDLHALTDETIDYCSELI